MRWWRKSCRSRVSIPKFSADRWEILIKHKVCLMRWSPDMEPTMILGLFRGIWWPAAGHSWVGSCWLLGFTDFLWGKSHETPAKTLLWWSKEGRFMNCSFLLMLSQQGDFLITNSARKIFMFHSNFCIECLNRFTCLRSVEISTVRKLSLSSPLPWPPDARPHAWPFRRSTTWHAVVLRWTPRVPWGGNCSVKQKEPKMVLWHAMTSGAIAHISPKMFSLLVVCYQIHVISSKKDRNVVKCYHMILSFTVTVKSFNESFEAPSLRQGLVPSWRLCVALARACADLGEAEEAKKLRRRMLAAGDLDFSQFWGEKDVGVWKTSENSWVIYIL